MTSTLSGHGLALTVHDGWEARDWMPDLAPPAENRPVVRLANFALPLTKNTYAEDVADGLRAGQVVAWLAESHRRWRTGGSTNRKGFPIWSPATSILGRCSVRRPGGPVSSGSSPSTAGRSACMSSHGAGPASIVPCASSRSNSEGFTVVVR